jgi:hypothetical protein
MQIEPARFVNRIAKQHSVVLADGDTQFLVTRDGRAIRVGEEGGRPIRAHAHRFFPRLRPPSSSPASARRLGFRSSPSSPTPIHGLH